MANARSFSCLNQLLKMKELFDILPQIGRVEWIGIRPARQVPMESLQSVTVLPQGRLAGDRYSGGTKGKRQITLIQAEHLETVASLLGKEVVPPDLVRRNSDK